MGSSWRPTPAEAEALRLALWAVRKPGWVQRDDLRQAGLIWLWQHAGGCQDRAYLVTCLSGAITDELRLQMGRSHCQHMPHPDAEMDPAHHDTPEAHARVRDALRLLERMPARLRRAVAQVLAADHLAGIGTGHAVREARAELEAVLL